MPSGLERMHPGGGTWCWGGNAPGPGRPTTHWDTDSPSGRYERHWYKEFTVMNPSLERLYAARDALARWSPDAPTVAITTGSGYGWLVDQMEQPRAIGFEEIPNMPLCNNPQHAGRFVTGRLFGHSVVVQHGRLHCYEGYRAEEVAFPARTLALWGVETFLLTNAAGAINPAFREGEFMAITDHINFIGQNPLTGLAYLELGERFPDLSHLYDPDLVARVKARMDAEGTTLHQGVYGGMPGPSYETPAEIRMLRIVGADAVGMSTVPEAIALGQMGRRVFGLSCLTNLAAGAATSPIRDDEIVDVLERAEVRNDL
ncbi:MAG TPA: purine-nucleoside phosphorylase, partial [Acidobacteria bacterium]|nr:purine-nucleoside phosphorylase [Acidobacteriota bacterium]